MALKGLKRLEQFNEFADRLGACHASGVDWDRRAIYIVGELAGEKTYQYIPALHILDESSGPIKIFIMSPGGEEPGGWALFDTIKGLKNPSMTIGLGGVYSIAALIFQAGSKRILAPNAQLMMHNGHLSFEAGDINSDLLKQLAREGTKNDLRYQAAIADRAKVDLKKVEQWCKDERYFLTKEAIEEGLADRLLCPGKDL